MTPYFKTTPEINYLESVNSFEYVRCENCGLVIAKTIYELDSNSLQKLNQDYFGSWQGTDFNADDPKWISRLKTQSKMFTELFREKIFDTSWKSVDYGCGDGKLADMINSNFLQRDEVKSKSFDLVATFSVHEHLLGKSDVDKILNLIKPNGIFALHTLVAEEIPCDPDWFYLVPVHCTFWTNASMKIFFKQYTCHLK